MYETTAVGAVNCAFGDPVTEGERVVLVHGVWYHKECYQSGRSRS